MSYSTSSKTHHQQKEEVIVQEKPAQVAVQEVVTTQHHSPPVVHHPLPQTPPREHRHHHLHHRNHDAHIGALPPPPPVPVVTPVVHHETPAVVVHSAPNVIHTPGVTVEERRTHHLQKTTVSVEEPVAAVKSIQEVVHHAPVKQVTNTVVHHRSPKTLFSPTEVFRSKTHHETKQTVVSHEDTKGLPHHETKTIVRHEAIKEAPHHETKQTIIRHEDTKGIPQEYLTKGRYVPNYRPAGQYSKCYCI